jgi:hypothetical protein
MATEDYETLDGRSRNRGSISRLIRYETVLLFPPNQLRLVQFTPVGSYPEADP